MTWPLWLAVALGGPCLLLTAGAAYAWWYAARHASLADYRAEIARRRTR